MRGGLVVGLALIPEALSFSGLAGVSPAVGLLSSVIMAISIAFARGRPAQISAATGAIALVIAPVTPTYGIDYLFATMILAGVFQLVFAALGVAKLQRFIPRSVMLGFVNALSILLFLGQLPNLIDVPWMVYPLVVAGLFIMIFWPKFTDVIPAPLVTIVVLTAVVFVASVHVPHGERHGRAPTLAAADVVAAGPVDLGDAADHRPVCTRRGDRGADEVSDDREARRRDHRFSFR